jgi:hypothetical protein
VKKNIREVRAGWICSIQLTIQRVGKPGERMPVLRVTRIKGPDKGLPGEPSLNVFILRDVVLIVKIDEGMVRDWTIDNPSPERQNQAKENYEIVLPLSNRVVNTIPL